MELLEEVLRLSNLTKAVERVVSNKGSAGVDGMDVEQGRAYFYKHREEICEELRKRSYKPKPVRRVGIPKPNGGVRNLGIPCVIDRIIQQAINQVLMPIYEEQFCEHSYGFRPGRNCQQAIMKSVNYLNEGYTVIVDIDLEKFFDKVNHDKLMQILNVTIKDGDLLSIIRKYLVSGIMVNGVVIDATEGTPQGGNLSPLLSNIMLNELDKELMKRGLRFVRYADDCNIYVKSLRAGQRVMESITDFIETKLKLKVNTSKSKVDYCYNDIKFLGFGFYYSPRLKQIRVKVHTKSVARIKDKLRKITLRSWSIDIKYRLLRLKQIITGWLNHYRIADIKGLTKELDRMVRVRLRMCIWKSWKTIRRKYKALTQLRNALKISKTNEDLWVIANMRNNYAYLASHILGCLIQNKTLTVKGLVSMNEIYTNYLNAC